MSGSTTIVKSSALCAMAPAVAVSKTSMTNITTHMRTFSDEAGGYRRATPLVEGNRNRGLMGVTLTKQSGELTN